MSFRADMYNCKPQCSHVVHTRLRIRHSTGWTDTHTLRSSYDSPGISTAARRCDPATPAARVVLPGRTFIVLVGSTSLLAQCLTSEPGVCASGDKRLTNQR